MTSLKLSNSSVKMLIRRKPFNFSNALILLIMEVCRQMSLSSFGLKEGKYLIQLKFCSGFSVVISNRFRPNNISLNSAHRASIRMTLLPRKF
jgi:hypothetical protein